jgi:hypothetical protein
MTQHGHSAGWAYDVFYSTRVFSYLSGNARHTIHDFAIFAVVLNDLKHFAA